MSADAAATCTVLIENERVKVSRWTLPVGAGTGFHRHALDYVVVPLRDASAGVLDAQGTLSRFAQATGVPYFRSAGVEHEVVAVDEPIDFIEVELVEAAPAP